MLTRRELAALALTAAAPVVGCGYPRSENALAWQDVGPLDDLPEDTWWEVSFALDDLDYTLWARRHGNGAEALDQACTHLGCPVRYVKPSQRFICPCHGAVFDDRGRPVGGPAKRPLRRWETRVRDGNLQVARRPS